ncbi:unnamed protein product, partial [marine sediment metagenome]
LKNLTLAMFKDLGNTLLNVHCFDNKIVYCNNSEILELADNYDLIGIKEELRKPRKTFDNVISELNDFAIKKYNAINTVFTFLDVVLISTKNFYEINSLMKKQDILVCPALQTGGISIFGRKPPNIISSRCFSDPNKTSLLSLFEEAKKKGLKITYYDSFRAGFDVDIKQDLVLAYKYLKIFSLIHKETYKFLKINLKLTLKKKNAENNRDLKIVEKGNTKF